MLRVIEESVEHRSRRERETDRVHITSHPRPLFRENRKGFEGAHPRKGVLAPAPLSQEGPEG